jgi:lipopolysaccharide/colanic/teichoic acid biosynthesis glycosyltransferase
MRAFSFILPVRVSGLIISDLLITYTCYLVATLTVLRGDAAAYLWGALGLLRILLVCLSLLLGLFVTNLYAGARVSSRVLLVLKMCNVVGIALVVQGLLAYLSSGLILGHWVMLLGSLFSFITLVAWRIFYSHVVLRIMGTRGVLFVGTDELIEEIASRIRRHAELGYEIRGYLDAGCEGAGNGAASLGPFLGAIDDLANVAERVHPDRIVFSERVMHGRALPVQTLLKLERSGATIEESATMFETVCGRISSRDLRASQIIFRNDLASRPGSLALQSVYTNLGAIFAFVVCLPVLALSAIAIRFTSRGPILEPDVRLGQYGIPFNLNRFRCHYVGNESAGESLDARLTPVGRLLKKFRLANLPQILNLLRGEMTLVGPKPERPEFAEELSKCFAYYRQRHAVKPGITGWSQINISKPGDGCDSLTQLEYDIYYTKHISLALDAYILLHEVRRLLPFANR